MKGLCIFILAAAGCGWAGAAPVIDGEGAGRWQAQAGWTPKRLAREYSVGAEGGWLAFRVREAEKQMTWTFAPNGAEEAGEPRWLVLRCKATPSFHTGKGETLLGIRAQGQSWITAVRQEVCPADGAEHVVAVDLESYSLAGPVTQIYVRTPPTAGKEGTLWAKLEFTENPPAEALKLTGKPAKIERVEIKFADLAWKPAPHFTPRPANSFAERKSGEAMHFAMTGARRSMRWSGKLPGTIDLSKTPFVALRYRARGEFGASGYVCHLGLAHPKGKSSGVYAMEPGDVVADGNWHIHAAKLEATDTTSGSIIAGIDCLSAEAWVELDSLTFSSAPAPVAIEKVLSFTARAGGWAAGQSGFSTMALPLPGRPSVKLAGRLGIGSWFTNGEIAVGDVPFQVQTNSANLLASGTVEEEDLVVPLQTAAKEILLLVAASFPRSEPFGAGGDKEAPLQNLEGPERASVELQYADGTADEIIPWRVALERPGIGRDIGLYAVHPAAGKVVTKLVFHDRMSNAAFGLLGLTVNDGEPRYAAKEGAQVWYPPVKAVAAAGAEFGLATQRGLAWEGVRSPMLGGALNLGGQPVFRVRLEEITGSATNSTEITSCDFAAGAAAREGTATRYTADYAKGGIHLRAELLVNQEKAATALVSLRLINLGARPVTGTLFFPTLQNIQIGGVEPTWYFCARRGGIINRLPAAFHDEIGEPHPLQVDGFFNPELGVGLACMPRDLQGVFRFYNVGKDAQGGNYSLEYLPQTVAAQGVWECVPVALSVVPGDWREQLREYQQWVKTWYQPQVPRKPWYRELWSFNSYNPGMPKTKPVGERLDFQDLAKRRNGRIPGSTDYVHCYGWAITPQFAHWGAYDHYESVGGKEEFRGAIERARQSRQPVGLYLDGYLVSTASDKPDKQQVQQWGVRQQNGQVLYHANYDAHSMCPYVPAWRDYLTAAYRRVAGEVKPWGMYLDEFGKCMTSRICYSREHGHPAPMGMCAGEWELTRQVRGAVPAEMATYCEYVPADVATQYLDGAYGHVSLYNYREGYTRLAPHSVNLHRFALPDFKTFELIYYTPLANGNWFLWKYPFFNGDGYYLTGTYWDHCDERAAAFLTRVLAIQHKHADAFTSLDVEPLVRTSHAGLYANRFSTAHKTVWTLYNATQRTIRGQVLGAAHPRNARYRDAWRDVEIAPVMRGDRADVPVEVAPYSVGCVVAEP